MTCGVKVPAAMYQAHAGQAIMGWREGWQRIQQGLDAAAEHAKEVAFQRRIVRNKPRPFAA